MPCLAPIVIAINLTRLFISSDIAKRVTALNPYEIILREFPFGKPRLVAKNRIGRRDFPIFKKAPRVPPQFSPRTALFLRGTALA